VRLIFDSSVDRSTTCLSLLSADRSNFVPSVSRRSTLHCNAARSPRRRPARLRDVSYNSSAARQDDSDSGRERVVARPAASTRLEKKYSSNVSVLEYSFNSTPGRTFQFSLPVFQINEQLLEFLANLAPSPSSTSCEFCDLIHKKLHSSLYRVIGSLLTVTDCSNDV